MNKTFTFDRAKKIREILILMAVGLILWATSVFNITLLVVYIAIILIVYMKSYDEKMITIEGNDMIFHYKKKTETIKIDKITLIEIEPRKATYRTMGSIKNMHVESIGNVVSFNIVNIDSKELNETLIELSKEHDFPYFKEHKDMKNDEDDVE